MNARAEFGGNVRSSIVIDVDDIKDDVVGMGIELILEGWKEAGGIGLVPSRLKFSIGEGLGILPKNFITRSKYLGLSIIGFISNIIFELSDR
jgi:hypothetical protein